MRVPRTDHDPRAASAAASEESVAPQVALPRPGLSWVAIVIGLGFLGLIVFSILDSNRRSLSAPAVGQGAASVGSTGANAAVPPLLYVPPEPAAPPAVVSLPPQREPLAVLPPPPPQIIYVPQPGPPVQQQVEPAPARVSGGPALVYDAGRSAEMSSQGPAPDKAGDGNDTGAGGAVSAFAGSRARSGVLANRSATVAQGTLIPAVLETGLDSTRPGFARAMVTRDVRGFDGEHILIPRGSRLIGEYRSDAQQGQKRTLVNWLRLIRPDGVTIAIASPASDPLGRGGIKASVNNHFFARFAGAILQSSLDLGVNLASRGTGSPVVVALPGTVQNIGQPMNQAQQITPTLTVKPGTSVTIFVARDLDFTAAGPGR